MNFLNWLLASSADPKRVSLAFKGAVITSAAFIVQAAGSACGLGLVCLGIDAAWMNQLANIVETMIFAIMLLIGSVAGLAGLLRKIKLGQWSAADLG